MEDKKFQKNNLGIWGWFIGGRYRLERYAYTLHRITGLGLLLYFIIHIFAVSARIYGIKTWDDTMAIFKHPIFHFGEFLVFAAFAIHALNGIRLVLTELGFALGKPIRPIYPYRVSIHRQRPLLIWIMVLAAILIIAGGFDFFMLKH